MSTDTHFWQNSVSCQQAVSERLSQRLFLAYFYTTASLSQHLYLTCFYLITPLEAISLYLCLHLFQVSERKEVFSGRLFSGPFFIESSSLSWASTESSPWGSWEVPFSTQTCKGSLHPIFQYINECGEQWQPQHQLLSNASSHQLPAGLRTADHRQYHSEPNVQLIFSH